MGGHSGGGGRVGRGGGGGISSAINDVKDLTDRERLIAVDANGNRILTTNDIQGDYVGVALTPAQLELLKGSNVIHNHPSPVSISVQDMETASKYNLKSMTAVTTRPNFESKKYTYTVKPGPKGWPPESNLRNDFSNAFDKAHSVVDKKIDKGTIKAESYRSELSHEIMKQVASKYSLKYTRR